MERFQKADKENHIKEFGGRNPLKRPGGHPRDTWDVWANYVEIQTQGTECPRDRRDI